MPPRQRFQMRGGSHDDHALGMLDRPSMSLDLSQPFRRFVDVARDRSVKSSLFETLQHVIVRCLRAELRGEPLSV
jgi:hypothetical protein